MSMCMCKVMYPCQSICVSLGLCVCLFLYLLCICVSVCQSSYPIRCLSISVPSLPLISSVSISSRISCVFSNRASGIIIIITISNNIINSSNGCRTSSDDDDDDIEGGRRHPTVVFFRCSRCFHGVTLSQCHPLTVSPPCRITLSAFSSLSSSAQSKDVPAAAAAAAIQSDQWRFQKLTKGGSVPNEKIVLNFATFTMSEISGLWDFSWRSLGFQEFQHRFSNLSDFS